MDVTNVRGRPGDLGRPEPPARGPTKAPRLRLTVGSLTALTVLGCLLPGCMPGPVPKAARVAALYEQATAGAQAGKPRAAMAALIVLYRLAPDHAGAQRLRRELAVYDPLRLLDEALREAWSLPATGPATQPAGPGDSLLGRLAVTRARLGDIPGAIAMAGRIEGAAERASVRAQIARWQAQSGDYAGARAAAAATHAELKAFIVLSIVEAQVQAGDISAAKATARSVPPAPHPVSQKDRVLAWLAGHLAEAGRQFAAQAIADEIADPRRRLGVYAEAAAARCRASDAEQAGHWLGLAGGVADRMGDVGDRVWAHCEIAEVRAQMGQPRRAEEAVRRAGEVARGMRGRPHASRSYSPCHCYCLIARSWAKIGRKDRVLEALKSAKEEALAMPDSLRRSGDLIVLACSQVAVGELAAAGAEIQALPEPFGQVLGYVELGRAQARAGDGASARESFALAEQTARSIQSALRMDVAWTEVAQAGAQAGLFPQAEAALQLIPDLGRRFNACLRVADICLAEGHSHEAGRALRLASAAARAIEDVRANAWACSLLAAAQAKIESLANALATARGIPADQAHARWLAFYAIGNALARQGDPAAMGRWIRDLDSHWDRCGAWLGAADGILWEAGSDGPCEPLKTLLEWSVAAAGGSE